MFYVVRFVVSCIYHVKRLITRHSLKKNIKDKIPSTGYLAYICSEFHFVGYKWLIRVMKLLNERCFLSYHIGNRNYRPLSIKLFLHFD